jgi:predicted RNA-binding Zn ribbon-like protein
MLTGYVFELDGGRLPLDFANTLSRQTGEHLPNYHSLVSFAVQCGLIDERRADRLIEDAARRPEVAAATLARAKELRAAVFGLFAGVARGQVPDPAALERLNGELAHGLGLARVMPAEGGYAWRWAESESLDDMLAPIARAAADMLVDDVELSRVRICAADDCDWLFLDTTKNRSRQWCSMASCGNRAKARRHYQRHKGS